VRRFTGLTGAIEHAATVVTVGRYCAWSCGRTFTLQRRFVEQRFGADVAHGRRTERDENELMAVVLTSGLRRLALHSHRLSDQPTPAHHEHITDLVVTDRHAGFQANSAFYRPTVSGTENEYRPKCGVTHCGWGVKAGMVHYISPEKYPRRNVYWPPPSVCLSVCPSPHSHTTAETGM